MVRFLKVSQLLKIISDLRDLRASLICALNLGYSRESYKFICLLKIVSQNKVNILGILLLPRLNTFKKSGINPTSARYLSLIFK